MRAALLFLLLGLAALAVGAVLLFVCLTRGLYRP